MVVMHKNIKRSLALISVVLVAVLAVNLWMDELKKEAVALAQLHRQETIDSLKEQLEKQFFTSENWPEVITTDEESFKVEYTQNEELTDYIRKLLKRYRSDYSAIVVIDNATGRILSAVGHERASNSFKNSLAFSTTHPGASLFKIVTSAELIENGQVDPTDVFNYRGRGTTLYKYQLTDKKNRWTRSVSFSKAFAYSNNVVFAKAAIHNTDETGIFKMAVDFGFNKNIMTDLALGKSTFLLPEDNYNLAEFASGFNKKTLMSPVHAAVLSSVVANGGKLLYPTLVKSVTSSEGEDYWSPDLIVADVISSKTAAEISEMMQMTVRRGTARGGFRGLSRSLRDRLIIGGKTGSITGGVPFGKRDWFTSFAVPKSGMSSGISVSVMNVNQKKWYVKSTFLARKVIEYYFKKIDPSGLKLSEEKTNLRAIDGA